MVAPLFAGCRAPYGTGDPEYAAVTSAMADAPYYPEKAMALTAPVLEALAGPHSVEEYVEYALSQNPDIQAARKQVEMAAYRVPQQASLQDPILGFTYLPEEIQTAAGAQRFQLKLSQRIPGPGKLSRRAAVAEAETDVVRARLAAVELEIVEQVKLAYYELYFHEQAIRITQQDRKLLNNLAQIAKRRLETGKISQQDVLRAELEVSKLDNELIRLRRQRDTAQVSLARLLHISPDTKVYTLDKLPQTEIPRDLSWLYSQALAKRPELHAVLLAIKRDQYRAALASLDYRPDLTASATWFETEPRGLSPVANGVDPFALGLSVNLPIEMGKLVKLCFFPLSNPLITEIVSFKLTTAIFFLSFYQC